jgi:endonuclease/exonuclease/phosphatase family metal-dependent hydrolase
MPKNLVRKLAKKILVIANIILAALFLLGSYGGWLNGKQWWPVGFLTLAAFYFLIFLIGFIFFWLFVKPRYTLISVIAILFAIKPLQQIIPLSLATGFNKQKETTTLRITSWNVEHFDILEYRNHPEKKQQMIDLVNDYLPDVACFQEMVGSEKFTDAVNYIPDMMRQMGYTNYHYAFNPKLDFDEKHHFGIITFSKFPIIKKETLQFYPFDYNSIFQYTDVLKGTDTIRIFNLHLQSLKFSADNLKYIDAPEINDKSDLKKTRNVVGKLKQGFLKRKIQADLIRTEIDKSPYPVIVCGDFNDVPNSYAYNTIGTGLQNAFAKKGSGIGRTYSGISPTLRIDNIFASPAFTIQQYTRVGKKLSDHFPIFADMQIEK